MSDDIDDPRPDEAPRTASTGGRKRPKDKSKRLNSPEKREKEEDRVKRILEAMRHHGFPITDESSVEFIKNYFEAYDDVINSIGRPTYYIPEMDEWAIYLGSRGYSLKQIATIFGISYTKLYDWANKNPTFGEALLRAREASQSWWEIIGQSSLFADRFQFGVWNKIVSTRFRQDYTDRKGIPYDPKEPEIQLEAGEVLQLDPRDLTEEQKKILRIAVAKAKQKEAE